MPSQLYGAGAYAYPEAGGARMLLPDAAPDGEVYLTTVQAAEAMGVTPRMVRYWVASGHLIEAVPGRKGRGGSALYAFSAVTGAERLAREAEAATRFQSVA